MSGATRVLHRFVKPGHVAEISERTVTQFRALKFIVFIDNSLHESQMFHGVRLAKYSHELETRCDQFRRDGWIEDPTARPKDAG